MPVTLVDSSGPPDRSAPARTDNRKVRCRLLDEHLNRCTSEALEDTGLCAHHLAVAHQDFLRLIGGQLTVRRGRRRG